ncbi:MAG: hypothetical protein A4E64_00106 [Syntrophorhabdus sp. PtaU1.Bin058]|nr:MAG: hypothetical protein A4E64_00106 [Syntrophorhabdus sp. PtaU1.Bin058]
MAKNIVKPGQAVPDSGIYRNTRTGERSTLVRGEPAPPTTGKGQKWTQVIDTNPKKK